MPIQSGELYHKYSGHFEEVTGLLLLGNKVVSVSIDATIRQWSLSSEDLRQAKLEAAGAAPESGDRTPQEGMLTEEEERELAALLDEDDT